MSGTLVTDRPLRCCGMKTAPLRFVAIAAVLSLCACSKDKNALQTEELRVGDGPVAVAGRTVAIHYTGYLDNGVKFDTTSNREPFRFQVGKGMVIKGWDQGIVGMKVGGRRRLIIPPALAYGARHVGPIPADARLTFEVDLVSVN